MPQYTAEVLVPRPGHAKSLKAMHLRTNAASPYLGQLPQDSMSVFSSNELFDDILAQDGV